MVTEPEERNPVSIARVSGTDNKIKRIREGGSIAFSSGVSMIFYYWPPRQQGLLFIEFMEILAASLLVYLTTIGLLINFSSPCRIRLET